MKRFAFFCVAAFVMFQGCGISETEKRENAVKDSITKIQQKEQARKDSVVQAEQDRAIGDILFGITEKEFEKKKEVFIEKCKVVDWVTSDGYKFYKHKIGEYKFSQIWGDYYKGKLYFVQIDGDPIHYEKYKSEMQHQADVILKVFENKYGAANDYAGIPEWHRTEKGYTYQVAYWVVGTKKIELRVKNDGIYYYLNIEIFQPAVSKQMEEEEKAKEKVSVEKATDLL